MQGNDPLLRELGEFKVIDLIQSLVGEGPSLFTKLAIGDDSAVLRQRHGFDVLVTCDSMVEDRHFLFKHFSFYQLGKRAMVQNISDIGAMGGFPVAAFVSLGLREDLRWSQLRSLYEGMMDELRPFRCKISGGNITSSQRLFVEVTLVGMVEPYNTIKRSGARPGDRILVTGQPGGAALGLKLLNANLDALPFQSLVCAYISPKHRALEARALGIKGLATSMIDISDGLFGDLTHICQCSRVGAVIWTKDLPMSHEFTQACDLLGIDPVAQALGPSDDYEILFTCGPGRQNEVISLLQTMGCEQVKEIGEIIQGEPRIILEGKEDLFLEGIRGWDHFLGPRPRPSL